MTAQRPAIRLRNSMTRKLEMFEPLDPENVRMYVCGPTVYDRAHLGNARPVVVFDVLFRLLRHVYGADHVTYVRNFTDVDDKINAEALRRQQEGAQGSLEELIAERTEETIAWYHQDMDALGALRPAILGKEGPKAEPRATQYIDEMQEMIQTLVENGHAYTVRDGSNNPPREYVLFDSQHVATEHVLFEVETFPEYGRLSGRDLRNMLTTERGEAAPNKRNPADFVLWKPSDASLPGWESPWGRGRPGWHIECSAMSHALLGESFDIHGGGIDLQFPHHENEIAQSACAHPDGEFAKYWLHNEMVMVDGKKMSKSLGNFFTVRDLLDRNIDGEVIRLGLLMTHYRKPMDWTTQRREQAESRLENWGTIRKRAKDEGIEPIIDPGLVDVNVLDALADDLNTPEAVTRLGWLGVEASMKYGSDAFNSFFSTLSFMGFEQLDPYRHSTRAAIEAASHDIERIEKLVERLKALRAARNWQDADALRDGLVDAGLKLQMGKGGEIDWEYSPELDLEKLAAIQ